MKLAVRRLARRLVESVKPSQQNFLNKISDLAIFVQAVRIKSNALIRTAFNITFLLRSQFRLT